MVVWALIARDIWALVMGGVASNVVRLALSHVLLPGIKNRPRWDRASAQQLMHFGRWIFMSTLLSFAVMQSDRLIFGKLVSMSMLGVYSIATIWATFPTQILGHVFQSVMFPMLSRIHNDRQDLPAAYREARAPWIIGAAWLTACLVSGGPTLIRFLYDERAAEAGWIVQILSIGTWFLALEMTNGAALLAQGKPKWVAAGSAAKFAGMVVLIPAGLFLFGFRGAVLGFAASELFRYMVSLAGANRSRLRGYKLDAMLTGIIVLTVGLGILVREAAWRGGIAHTFRNHVRLGAFVEGAAIFAVLTAVWVGVFWSYKRRLHLRVPLRLA
jgi:O-antigen/teichoic acid export membrane protein